MNITYIHQHFKLPREDGGSRPYEFARRMVAEGHRVTMICGGEEALDETVEGIQVRRLAVPYDNSMSMAARMVSFARFMIASSAVAARTRPDVVFASSTPLTVAIPGIVTKLVRRVPMVFEVRDLWPEVPVELGFLKNPAFIALARGLEKIAYKASKKIVALSPGMRDGVVKVDPSAEVTIVPNASDVQLFSRTQEERAAFRAEQGWGEEETVIVYAGGFGYVYELEWAVELAAKLKDDNVRFILLGAGSSTPVLETQAKALGLNPAEILPGKQPKVQVANYVASADLVLSSLRLDPCLEPCSLNKVFDAMAASRPILFNHKGWLRDLAVEQGAGFDLPRDLNEAAEIIRQLRQHPALLRQAADTSGRIGREQFDRDLLFTKLMKVLYAAVEEN